MRLRMSLISVSASKVFRKKFQFQMYILYSSFFSAASPFQKWCTTEIHKWSLNSGQHDNGEVYRLFNLDNNSAQYLKLLFRINSKNIYWASKAAASYQEYKSSCKIKLWPVYLYWIRLKIKNYAVFSPCSSLSTIYCNRFNLQSSVKMAYS